MNELFDKARIEMVGNRCQRIDGCFRCVHIDEGDPQRVRQTEDIGGVEDLLLDVEGRESSDDQIRILRDGASNFTDSSQCSIDDSDHRHHSIGLIDIRSVHDECLVIESNAHWVEIHRGLPTDPSGIRGIDTDIDELLVLHDHQEILPTDRTVTGDVRRLSLVECGENSFDRSVARIDFDDLSSILGGSFDMREKFVLEDIVLQRDNVPERREKGTEKNTTRGVDHAEDHSIFRVWSSDEQNVIGWIVGRWKNGILSILGVSDLSNTQAIDDRQLRVIQIE